MIINDCICIHGNTGWFVGTKDSILYEISMNEFKIKALTALPSSKNKRVRISQRIVYNDDKLYVLPDQAYSIFIYDLQKKSWEKINIPSNYIRPCILNAWFDDDIMYCYLHLDNEVMWIDLKERRFLKSEKIFDDSNIKGAYESLCLNGLFYFISRNDSRICEYNPKNNKKKYYVIDESENGFNTLSYDVAKNCFYITGYSANLYIWSKEKNLIETIPISMADSDGEHTLFFSSSGIGGNIVFVPYNVNFEKNMELIVFNTDKKDFIIVQIPNSCGNSQNIIECIYHNNPIILNHSIRSLIEVDIIKHKTKKIEVGADNARNQVKLEGDITISESKFVSLSWFLEGICK